MKYNFKSFLTISVLITFGFGGTTANHYLKADFLDTELVTIQIKNLSNCEIPEIEFYLANPYEVNGILYTSFYMTDNIIRARGSYSLLRKRNTAVKYYTYTCYCDNQKPKYRVVEKYFSVKIGETKIVEINCE